VASVWASVPATPWFQIQDEGRIAEALGIGKRRLVSERPESGLENGQCRLTGQIVIGEGLSSPVGDVEVEVLLRPNEFTEETILEDVDLLQILTVPHVSRFVSHLTRLKSEILSELALNAKAPVMRVRRPQIRIYVVAHSWRREGVLEDRESELRGEDRTNLAFCSSNRWIGQSSRR
jgi:hypothetical protein